MACTRCSKRALLKVTGLVGNIDDEEPITRSQSRKERGTMTAPTPQQSALVEAFHLHVLRQHDPELYHLAQQTRAHVMRNGALSAKTKTLMAMLCDAVRDRH